MGLVGGEGRPCESGELCFTWRLGSCTSSGEALGEAGGLPALCSRKEVWGWTLSPATCSLTSFLPECLETLGRAVGGTQGGAHTSLVLGLEGIQQPVLHF